MTFRLLRELTTILEGRYFLKATADKSPTLIEIELACSLKPLTYLSLRQGKILRAGVDVDDEAKAH